MSVRNQPKIYEENRRPKGRHPLFCLISFIGIYYPLTDIVIGHIVLQSLHPSLERPPAGGRHVCVRVCACFTMYVYVRVCTCVYVCVLVSMRVYLYTLILTSTHTCVYL